MFQVLVVENADERHLATASWAFPLYVLLMSLFVVPIAVVGLDLMPAGANPDMFVLTVPLAADRPGLAMFAFLGGFSSATSMVIVATIALATMVSNHIVVPLWLRSRAAGRGQAGDMRLLVLMARRLSIAGVLALGYAYYHLSGGGAALSAMGLIAFAGVAQILPAMLGGIFWRGASRSGAAAALVTGCAIWLWTLFLPSFGDGAVIPADVMAQGPWGLGWLRPQALFGITGIDPLMHAVLWSMLFNALVFFTVSILTFPAPLERLQGAAFVNVFDTDGPGTRNLDHRRGRGRRPAGDGATAAGPQAAQAIFRQAAGQQGKEGYLPAVTPAFVEELERELAGSVGAATAHAMIAQIAKGRPVSVEDLIRVADEAAQIMETSQQLQTKSAELQRTAQALSEANEKLTQLSIQKDTFLSQVSHELRTPMTSIRAFSELLKEGGLTPAEQQHFAGIIAEEAVRLTRLLDDLLDLSVLENGGGELNRQEACCRGCWIAPWLRPGAPEGLRVLRHRGDEGLALVTDLDRLSQVFINLIANAQKYCDATRPELRIRAHADAGQVMIDFVDNGRGIPAEHAGGDLREVRPIVGPGQGRRRGPGAGDLPRDHGTAGWLHHLSAGAGRCGIPRVAAAGAGDRGLTAPGSSTVW